MEMIPYGRQFISEEDVQAVIDVLRSDFLTQGERVTQFESAVAAKVGAKHGIAVNSATSALHIACLALGVGPDDCVWTTPNTFVATANAALYCGASVDFVDIDPVTFNLDAEKLENKLIEAEKKGVLPKVVIPVHFAGQPCEMATIHGLGKRFGFSIIEDASHAIGAHYQDTTVGDCHYSHITVFSFHPVKIITTAEGGLALTNNEELAACMASLRSHGVTRDVNKMSASPDGAWYYEQQSLGFNYRMTELQAALGLSQLHNLENWIKRRHQIADNYDLAFKDLPLILPIRPQGSYSALHLYPIQVDNRRRVFDALRSAGIGVNVHYIPVHTQPYYQSLGFGRNQFPHSEAYYARAISLPMFASLTDQQQERVITALKAILT